MNNKLAVVTPSMTKLNKADHIGKENVLHSWVNKSPSSTMFFFTSSTTFLFKFSTQRRKVSERNGKHKLTFVRLEASKLIVEHNVGQFVDETKHFECEDKLDHVEEAREEVETHGQAGRPSYQDGRDRIQRGEDAKRYQHQQTYNVTQDMILVLLIRFSLIIIVQIDPIMEESDDLLRFEDEHDHGDDCMHIVHEHGHLEQQHCQRLDLLGYVQLIVVRETNRP